MAIKKDCDSPNNTNTICVNTDKVFDWIIEESTGSTSLPIGALPITIPADATNIEITCFLSNNNGEPVPLNISLNISESSPREDHQFTINGNTITLQRVSFTKTLYVVLEISGVDPTDGSRFLIASDPISFTFFETAFLCAPSGTSLDIKISNFDYLTFIRRNEADEIIGFGLNIFICQSIQTIAPVTLEVRANICEPREQISEPCRGPSLSNDCSVIFPGN